jgi:predicted membrane-bound dolichyl-phosphate-mannose-protein mannosyltransferase
VGYRLIRRSKDWASAEFPFLSFSHKLSMNVRKEIVMTLAFAAILLIRLILPIVLLISLGEWVRRREASYWLSK